MNRRAGSGYHPALVNLGLLFLGAYFVLKGAAYCAWCWVGVRTLRPERVSKFGLAMGLGVFRMLLGLAFGAAIFFVGSAIFESLAAKEALDPSVAMALTYLAVYVPVRWFEWGIVETMLFAGKRDFTTVLGGSGGRGVRWRLGGIALSCLADVPWMMAVGGIPVGRFMC